MSDYFAQYAAIRDALNASKDLADVMRLLEHHLSNEGIQFKIIEDYERQEWHIYALETARIELPTFAQAFDYLITEVIKKLKAKREIPTE